MSAHGLAVETGRHGELRESIVNRTCVTCCDRDGIEAIALLPFLQRFHVLHTCTLYDAARLKLSHENKTLLFSEPALMFSGHFVRETSRYISKIIKTRFTKKERPKKTSNSKEPSKIWVHFWVRLLEFDVYFYIFNFVQKYSLYWAETDFLSDAVDFMSLSHSLLP